MKELVIPPPAKRDDKAVEMIRAWIAERGLHCTINIGMWRDNGQHDEAKAWGILLADVIKHVANAMKDRYDEAPNETTRKIINSLGTELKLPTSEAHGYFWHH